MSPDLNLGLRGTRAAGIRSQIQACCGPGQQFSRGCGSPSRTTAPCSARAARTREPPGVRSAASGAVCHRDTAQRATPTGCHCADRSARLCCDAVPQGGHSAAPNALAARSATRGNASTPSPRRHVAPRRRTLPYARVPVATRPSHPESLSNAQASARDPATQP